MSSRSQRKLANAPSREKLPTSAIRVLTVSGLNFLGGGELQLLRLLPRLQSQDCVLRAAILASSGGELEQRLRGLGLAVDTITMGRARYVWKTAGAVGQLARLGRQVDLLHANDIRAAVWCQVASLLARRPWVWHVRDLLTGSHRFERAARWVRPTRVITNSHAVKRQALSFAGWDSRRVDVVWNGIDSQALAGQADRPKWRAEMELADTDLAVGIVARLEPWKGHEDFLRAAALVTAEAPSARFFVVGGVVTDPYTARLLGDERGRLERLAAELGLTERVTFTGQRQDIGSVMAGLDVLVLASHAEPFGNVLLEAMALGTPVVATAAGGAEEVVVDGETGLLVPPRQPAAIGNALKMLLRDPERLRTYGAAGQRRVRELFTLERQAQQVYQTWMRAAGRPAHVFTHASH